MLGTRIQHMREVGSLRLNVKTIFRVLFVMKSKKKIVNNLIKTPFPKSNPLKDIFLSLVFGNKII